MAKQPDFKETTSLQQYRGAIDFLQTHIQLLDASLIQTSKILSKQTDQEKYINSILELSDISYNKLNHPAKQHNAIIKYSQKKNIEFAILRLYNLFTSYLQSITKEMFATNPMLVVGKAVINKNGDDKENLVISYAEIVRLNSFENIQEQMILRIFRSMEDLKSTSKLLEKILKDTKVIIPKAITDDALAYLEMRHLFVHNQGVVDNKFAKTYGNKFTPILKEKRELPAKIGTFTNALTATTKLITEIDKQLISKGMVAKREIKLKRMIA